MNRRNRRLRTTLLLVAMVVVVGAALALEPRTRCAPAELTQRQRALQDPRDPAAVPSNVVIVGVDDKTFNDLQVH